MNLKEVVYFTFFIQSRIYSQPDGYACASLTCVSYRADDTALIAVLPRNVVQKIITEYRIVACNIHIAQKSLAESNR